MTQMARRALVPEDLIRHLPPSEHFIRAAALYLRSAVTRMHRAEMATEIYGDIPGRPVELIIRAATNPATIAATGWASDLVTTALADFWLGSHQSPPAPE
jgi:hypothetical protein